MPPRLATGAFASLLAASVASSCSDFRLNASLPETVVSARTLDSSVDLKTAIEVIPRGSTFHELPTRDCQTCEDPQWISTYGFVALNVRGVNVAVDGLNEKGLSAAWLYLSDEQRPVQESSRKAVRSNGKPVVASVCTYILGNFANVDEVRRGLARFQVVPMDERVQELAFRGLVPRYVSVRDADGKSLVIDLSSNELKIVDRLNQVLPIDRSRAERAENIGDDDDLSFIPGGFIAVERFLRLWLFNYHPHNQSDEQSDVSKALRILRSVVRSPGLGEATQWSVVRDHKRCKLYVQSAQNAVPRAVDLSRFNLSHGASRKMIPATFGDWFVSATPTSREEVEPKAPLLHLWSLPTMPPSQDKPEENVMEAIKSIFESNPSTTFWSGAASGALAVLVVLRFFSLVHIDTRIRLYRSGSVFRRAARSVRNALSWRR